MLYGNFLTSSASPNNLLGLSLPVFWLVLIVLLIIIEILTLGVTTIWFASGALAAFIVSILYDNFIIEFIVFLIVSIILLYFTRPIVLKYFNPKREKTNYERLIGMEGIVLLTIDNVKATGKIEVYGQEWTARSLNNEIIEKNSKVVVKEISGVKAIVERVS